MNLRTMLLVSAALASAAGCLSVKTESEIKPIHITMDVNLKVDREIDKALQSERDEKSKAPFAAIRALLERKAAGVTNRALLEPRAGATDEDRVLIARANARRTAQFGQIARESGVSLDAVQRRSAKKFADRIPAGSGIWLQADDGSWSQK